MTENELNFKNSIANINENKIKTVKKVEIYECITY